MLVVLLAAILPGACAPGTDGWTTGTASDVPAAPTAAGVAEAPQRRRAPRVRAAAPTVEPAVEAEAESDDAPAASEEAGGDEGPATCVVGRVTDLDGTPIRGAQVACFLGVSTVEDLADDDGRFRVAVAEPTGVVRCLAWARGYAVVVGEWRTLSDGETLDVGTIRLGPSAPIAGRIVDPDGVEVAESYRVWIESADTFDEDTWAIVSERLGADGRVVYASYGSPRFEFESLPPGRYVLAFRPNGRSAEPLAVTAPAEDVTFVVSRDLPPPAVAFETRVRFVDAAGAPAAFRTVFVRKPGDETGEGMSVRRLDRDGGVAEVRVEVPALPVELVVRPEWGADVVRTIDSPPGDEIEVRLPPPEKGTPTIAGTVTSGGFPLTWSERATASCLRMVLGTPTHVYASRSDGVGPSHNRVVAQDGTFVLEGLDDAEYDVWAHTEVKGDVPLAPAETRVRAGACGVVLDLPRAATRRFDVRGPGGETPDEIDACVEATDEEAADGAESETQGAAIIASLLRPGASYRLTVRGRIGRTWTAWTRVEGWTAGDGTIPVRLESGLTITGRVVREGGTRVPAAYVYAEQGDDHADTYAALDGTFTLTGLSPGEWSLNAYSPASSNSAAPAAVRAGTTGVEIVIVPRSDRR